MTATLTRVPLCTLDELPVGLGRAFEVGGQSLAVFRGRGDEAGTAGGARREDRAADQGEVGRRPAYCDAHLISPRQAARSIIRRANDRWGLP